MTMTEHAQIQSFARRLPEDMILTTIEYGRELHTRGAVLFAVGKKEVAKARRDGMDISKCEGVHIVCTSDDRILIVYRNRNLRGLRQNRRSRTFRYRFNAEQKRGTFFLTSNMAR